MFSKKTLVWASLMLALCAPVATVYAANNDGFDSLRQTSKAFASVAKQVSPSVVFVQVETAVQPNAINGLPAPFGDELFRRFFGEQFPGMRPRQQHPHQQQPPERRMSGQGSGFVFKVDTKDAKKPKSYILTNNHVINQAEKIKVTFQDGKEYTATVAGADPKSDIAILEISDASHPALILGSSAKLDVGEWVVAVGNPFGLSHTLTVGVVSAKGRSGLGINDYEDFIQTDAAINPGNSGGPLLNLNGEVIGINTAIFSRSGGYMGVGFAIPVDLVQNIASQLIDTGEVARGYLGIVIQDVTSELAESLDLKRDKGVLVSQVSAGSPAEQAGIKAGDVIVSYQGEKVTEVADFRNRVALTTPGKTAALTLVRDGESRDVKVKLGNLEDGEQQANNAAENPSEIGFSVQNLTAELAQRYEVEPGKGVLVTQVKPNSVAAMAGIRPGTVVLQVNRQPVGNAAEFQAAVKKAAATKRVLLLLSNQGMSRYVVLNWN